MGVIIVGASSGAGQEIDSTPKAGRAILYDSAGAILGTTANPIATDDAASSVIGSTIPSSAAYQGVSDGTNLRGALSTSATNLTLVTTNAIPLTVSYAAWSITHLPATATKATISKAAGTGTVRHICTGFVASLATGATVQTPVTCSIRDGATGAGTVLWSFAIAAPINGSFTVSQTNLCLIGSANTAMTIEFSAAGVTASQQTVSLQGFSVS